MKKNFSMVLIGILMLVFTACEDKAEDNTPNAKTTQESTTEETAKYASVEEFVNSAEFQAVKDSALAQNKIENSTMDIIARGNELVYIHTYTDVDISTYSAEEVKIIEETIQTMLLEHKNQYFDIVTQLKSEIKNESVFATVEFKDMNGQIIFTQSYTIEY